MFIGLEVNQDFFLSILCVPSSEELLGKLAVIPKVKVTQNRPAKACLFLGSLYVCIWECAVVIRITFKKLNRSRYEY